MLFIGLCRSELAVAGVAQAWYDVAGRWIVRRGWFRRQVIVDRRDVDVDIRVRLAQVRQAFRSGDQAHELDALRPPTFEDVDGGYR